MNYKDCILCGRNCHINRDKIKGPCGADKRIIVARAALHYYEEPIISGINGRIYLLIIYLITLL